MTNIKIRRPVIRSALLGFLEMLENTGNPESIQMLEMWLGELAFLQHFVGDVQPEDREHLTPLARPDMPWRRLIAEQFPALGYYNLPVTDTAQIATTTILTGDAVDDLADIAAEISECLHRWEHAGENNALWYFQFSYQSHWETHLRNLQAYLHNLS